MRDGGKGDVPRPIQNRKEYESNWDRIFKEKDGSFTTNIGENDGLSEICITNESPNAKKPV
jgi:hypothetical protein